jgi:hypothetical protein
MSFEDSVSQFKALAEQFRYKFGISSFVRDFAAMGAIALRNSIEPCEREEKRYLSIAKRYSRKELDVMAELLGITVNAVKEHNRDFLGEVIMGMGLGQRGLAQHFSPFSVSIAMSEILIDERELERKKKTKELIEISDPCCGGGVLILAGIESHLRRNVPIEQLLITAVDKDVLCRDICYIQLAAIGAVARVVHGDSLAVKEYSTLETPKLIHFKRQLEIV